MSAALQSAPTSRERRFETVIDQLVPLYAQIYDGDVDIARQAALDAMDPYLNDEAADLTVAGQIVACGLASMRVFQMCMKPDATPADMARLCRTADTLSRTEQRHRTTGLHPTPPKPATTRAAIVHSLPAKALPSIADEAPVRKARGAVADFMTDFQPQQTDGHSLTHEEYCEIYRASRDGRLGEIMPEDTGSDDEALIDRIRAAAFPSGTTKPRA